MLSRISVPAGKGALAALGLATCLGATATAAAELSPVAPDRIDLGELQRCRSLSDALQRLVCYDRVLPPLSAAPAGPQARGAATVSAAATAATAVTGDTGGTAAAKTAGAPPVAGLLPAQAAAQFGLPRADDTDLQRLTSVLPGAFTGWSRGHRFELANGQVWEVIDNSVGAYRLQSPKVSVQRGFLGSYFLEIEGVQQTPKVRRIR